MNSTYGVVKAWRERLITGNEALEMSGLNDVGDLADLADAYGLEPRPQRSTRRRGAPRVSPVEQLRARN